MSTFLLVAGFFIVVILAMSVGVIMGRKPISGSCGGMSALGMDVACDICGGDKNKCEKEKDKITQSEADTSLAHDAMKDGK
ncbi:MAG: (Na+)-NQR maturation NqrM [Gammaproteobacteria bacterium]|nr:MAG: (Na+)-NQR maturation NqrM [Gammaproteobacteria bacterium]